MSEGALTTGGHSIFHDTIADITFEDLRREIAAGAVALWPLGVIEEHGPHLPLGTDVYLPYAQLVLARRRLAHLGVPAVIIPPFYWGVNHVTGGFTGSINIRPEIMVEVMLDVFRSLNKDGFRRAFCVSGQGDIVHNRALTEGVRRARAELEFAAYFVMGPVLLKRLALTEDEPYVVVLPDYRTPGAAIDVHAGAGETSLMWGAYPDLVRDDLLTSLHPTEFTAEDLAEWRRGGVHTVRKTPLGYVGDPAAADRAAGRQSLEHEAALIADSIAATLRRGR